MIVHGPGHGNGSDGAPAGVAAAHGARAGMEPKAELEQDVHALTKLARESREELERARGEAERRAGQQAEAEQRLAAAEDRGGREREARTALERAAHRAAGVA